MESGIDKKTADWKKILSQSIRTPEQIPSLPSSEKAKLSAVSDVYPMLVNSYFMKVCQDAGAPLWKQVVPDPKELEDSIGKADPLEEERDSPVACLTHRYPDRVLLLAGSACAVYCRFCTRKRKIGRGSGLSDEQLETAAAYIEGHPEIKDVLISGGDPLVLEDSRLEKILTRIRKITHVEVIRIGSRVPGVLPQRITSDLAFLLKKFQPLFLNLHFNHPAELTDPVRAACTRLADAGIPLGSQTVLLRGINDDASVLSRLFRELLRMRIKPYYLLQADLTLGTDHFRTRLEDGLEIMQKLRGYISGLAVPHYVIDLPGGGGKVPMIPDYRIDLNPEYLESLNYKGEKYRYPQIRT